MVKGNYLSRDQIIGSSVQTRDVEAFGGIVCVKELSAKAMADLLAGGGYDQESGQLDFAKINLIELCASHIIDPESQDRILRKGDVEKLATKSWTDIVRIATVVLEVSGIEVETQDVTVTQSEDAAEKNG